MGDSDLLRGGAEDSVEGEFVLSCRLRAIAGDGEFEALRFQLTYK